MEIAQDAAASTNLFSLGLIVVPSPLQVQVRVVTSASDSLNVTELHQSPEEGAVRYALNCWELSFLVMD
jgi:hypothetical protein